MKASPVNLFILGLVGFTAYNLFGSSSASAKNNPLPAETPNTGGDAGSPAKKAPTPTKSPIKGGGYPIEKGSRGPLVVELQKFLGITASGIFDTVTENSLLTRYGISKIYTRDGFNRLERGEIHVTGNPATAPKAPAPAAPVVTPKASKVDLTAVFNALWTPSTVQSNYIPHQYAAKQGDLVKVFAHYTDPQLKAFELVYYSTFKTKNRPGVKSLVADLKNSIPQASWTPALAQLVNRLVNLK